jgi:hypothetical protein
VIDQTPLSEMVIGCYYTMFYSSLKKDYVLLNNNTIVSGNNPSTWIVIVNKIIYCRTREELVSTTQGNMFVNMAGWEQLLNHQRFIRSLNNA